MMANLNWVSELLIWKCDWKKHENKTPVEILDFKIVIIL